MSWASEPVGVRGSGAVHIGAWISVGAGLVLSCAIRCRSSRRRLAFAIRSGPAAESRLLPKPESNCKRIDVELGPPRGLVGMSMELAVMDPTNRHGELVTDPTPERASLGEPEVMRIRRYPCAYEARLPGDEFQMVLVANAHRFPERTDCAGALGFAGYGWRFLVGAPVKPGRRHRCCDRRHIRDLVDGHATNSRQLCLKSLLNNLRIACHQRVLGGKAPMGPGGRVIG
jgi:hypothetical protein